MNSDVSFDVPVILFHFHRRINSEIDSIWDGAVIEFHKKISRSLFSLSLFFDYNLLIRHLIQFNRMIWVFFYVTLLCSIICESGPIVCYWHSFVYICNNTNGLSSIPNQPTCTHSTARILYRIIFGFSIARWIQSRMEYQQTANYKPLYLFPCLFQSFPKTHFIILYKREKKPLIHSVPWKLAEIKCNIEHFWSPAK